MPATIRSMAAASNSCIPRAGAYRIAPQQFDAVLRKFWITRYERHGFAHRLRDQHPVEGIAVEVWKFRDACRMFHADTQRLHAHSRQRLSQALRVEIELAERHLDRNFPCTR